MVSAGLSIPVSLLGFAYVTLFVNGIQAEHEGVQGNYLTIWYMLSFGQSQRIEFESLLLEIFKGIVD